MKKLLIILIFTISLSARTISPNEVYSLSVLIQDHIHFLLKYYGIKHDHNGILKKDKILSAKLKPRNVWQKNYEVLVKINMLRQTHGLQRIEPVGIEAREHLTPDLVYEMNERILTELKIFEMRKSIDVPKFKRKKFVSKTPLNNYNAFVDISAALDELNQQALTPDYVYAETMRIYDDIGLMLSYLDITDNTSPEMKKINATPKDSVEITMKILDYIGQLQVSVGIEGIDFSEFNKEHVYPSDVYTMTGLILAELQTIKAYIGLTNHITPSALAYSRKKPENVGQLMTWNLKRLKLIRELHRRGK
ncbi:hypothetical protein N9X61_02980 [Sulfurimonas sp.]|nr:hypothetical protein [Sulfurimonas sp.]